MLVSVVMAVYNGARYLREAIDSILVQTYRNIELIIVDDASTDATRAILQTIDDHRVTVFRFPSNQGASAALNYAIARTKGDWFAVHDADDLSHPLRIMEQVRYLNQNPGLVAAGSFIKCITNSDRKNRISEGELRWFERTRNSVQTKSDIRLGLYSGCPITHGTLIISKKAFHAAGGYDPRLRIVYDYDLCTRLVTVGAIENVPKKLYRYRRHGSSLSAGKNLAATNDELFYSFAKYVRQTCFQHLDTPPLLAVCGSKEGTLHFARQAVPVLAVRVAAGLNKKSLQQLVRDYRHRRLDGAVILYNYSNCSALLNTSLINMKFSSKLPYNVCTF